MPDLRSADLEITVPLLVQIDKLVQLIESPVFTCEHSGVLATDVLKIAQTYVSNFWNPINILISSSAYMVS